MPAGNVNQESKRIFAKLLATEDIMVRNDCSAHTASFDTNSRVLTLPVLNGMDNDVYDLFVGHEVGHALFTPAISEQEMIDILNKVCDTNIVLAKHIMNVVEDARIERMMRSKYPGLGKNFIRGYRKLCNDEFFGETLDKFDKDLNIIDRLNLWYKLGIYGIVDLDMNEIEDNFIQMMDSAKTFEDVIDISKKIVDHLRNESDKNKELLEIQDSEEMQEILVPVSVMEFSGEGDGSQNSSEDNDDLPENDNMEKSVVSSTVPGTSFTKKNNLSFVPPADVLSNYVKKNVSSGSEYTIFNSLPEPNLSKIIIPSKDVHKEIEKIYNAHLEHSNGSIMVWTGGAYFHSSMIPYNINEMFSRFDTECRNSISGMAAAFKRKQQAYISRRTSVGKTGRIDMNNVHRYKFDDDLFLRSTFVPKGKNHGMIFYLDWSGSMTANFRQTIEQAIYLAYFCRTVKIPFRLYGFSDSPFMAYANNPDYNGNLVCWNGDGTDKHGNKFARPNPFHLYEYLSSEMNSSEFIQAVKNVLYLSDYITGKFNFHTGHSFSLGGTPLNEAILASITISKEFQKANNIQIMNNIFLTDGESGGRMICYNEQESNYAWRSGRKIRHTLLYRNRPYEVNENSRNFGNDITNTLLEILREEANTRTIGFFLGSSRFVENICNMLYNFSESTKKVAEFRKNSFVSCNSTAYDEFYIMLANASVMTMDEVFNKIENNSDTKKIISSFVKSANTRGKSRILLNSFAELVAQDLN